MEPQLDRTPGLALPQPSTERGVDPRMPYQAGTRTPEFLAAAPEANVQPAAPSFATPIPGAVPLPPPQPSGAPVTATPAIVARDDNTDELDQEWVHKAKAIVERTKSDPFIESSELSKAKAEYLRIRYNKHIKVVEEQAK